MRMFIIGVTLGILASACAMSGKSKRLRDDMDRSKTPWEFCTPKMVDDYKGKLCLIECKKKLKKDGSCKDNKYKYIIKDLKVEHSFFMDKFIAVPEDTYY